jgi:subtilisin family serine protease
MAQMGAEPGPEAAAAPRMLAPGRRAAQPSALTALIVEASKAKPVEKHFQNLAAGESVRALAGGFYSALISPSRARDLLGVKEVVRVQTKKKSRLHLEAALPEARVMAAAGARLVAETGAGVVIGIVDSGFDLSHPMFRDAQGRLRVDALLDQETGREFTTAQLEQGWANGSNPGADEDGHGTHVASIAGGSRFQGREGVAPEARFVLVKTDFVNTDTAVSFIFQKAGTRPCVVNMSLGHHFGAHDGSDAEERFHDAASGPGRIIVLSAGNEATDRIHLGGRFSRNQTRGALFDFFRQPDGPPFVAVTAWYDRGDIFEGALVRPNGQSLAIPAVGAAGQRFSSQTLRIDLSRRNFAFNNLVQVQIQIEFLRNPPASQARNWGLRFVCRRAIVGRLDAWFHNSGFAEFRPATLVEAARTVGLAATGKSSIAVASYVSKNEWDADDGHQVAPGSVPGRISSFSSLGPTRDGREKPDIAAPGEFLTAALAAGSASAGDDERADNANRVLTIEGTSMAAPMVTGIVALMLQKRGSLTPDQARQILFNSARKDIHTGPLQWTPQYGRGKIDAAQALANT